MNDRNHMPASFYLLMMIWWVTAELWICGVRKRGCSSSDQGPGVTSPIFVEMASPFPAVASLPG